VADHVGELSFLDRVREFAPLDEPRRHLLASLFSAGQTFACGVLARAHGDRVAGTRPAGVRLEVSLTDFDRVEDEPVVAADAVSMTDDVGSILDATGSAIALVGVAAGGRRPARRAHGCDVAARRRAGARVTASRVA